MAKFKTKDGKEWPVELTVGHLRRLRTDCGIEMRDALKPGAESLATAMSDPDKFGQMMWILCGPDAERAGLTPETFVDGFDGEVFRAATAAVWDAIFSFYQGLQAGKKAGEAMRTGMEKIEERYVEAWTRAETSLISKLSAGNSVEPPELTPVPSP